jgi:serine/threonine protein kinase
VDGIRVQERFECTGSLARATGEDVFRGVYWVYHDFPLILPWTLFFRRPYRAPELLFGTRSYDPFAIDLWSFGATFAEFFTPLCLLDSDHAAFDDEESSNVEESQPPRPFFVARNPSPDARWIRNTLFDSSRGELGLAWSIFRVRGTPTPDIWPVCFLSYGQPSCFGSLQI